MTLKELIESHPSYVDATNPTDQVIYDWLNEIVSKRSKTSLSGDELYNAVDATVLDSLTDAKKSQWLALCDHDSIDPFTLTHQMTVMDIFGKKNAVIPILNAARTELVDRITNAGITRENLDLSLINSLRNA